MHQYEKRAKKFKVLGHPVRLQILDMLRTGEICVCHIEHALDKRQSYISQQLMTLRKAQFVDFRKDGLQVYYRIVDKQLVDLLNLMIGSQVDSEFEVLEDCHCPSCTRVVKSEIE